MLAVLYKPCNHKESVIGIQKAERKESEQPPQKLNKPQWETVRLGQKSIKL